MAKIVKVCPVCGKEFSGVNTKYCCASCRSKATYEGKREKLVNKCKAKDLTGQRFGKLIVIGLDHKKQIIKNGIKDGWHYYYKCKCDCGNETVVLAQNLKSNKIKSCGCLIRLHLEGKRFGKLLVLEEVQTKKRGSYWLCQCDCGNKFVILGTRLTKGEKIDCNACARKRSIGGVHRTHGMKHTRLYRIWHGIKTRCFNANDKGYKNYGGRGITMCPEWKDDFMAFHDWAMSNGYEEGLSIDRINNNGNYEPSNCRWADGFTQQNNRRVNRYLTFNGETHTYREWSRITGINHCTISVRINKYGWSIEKALTTPPKNKC